MVTFILVRHAESTDNIHSLWAGWKDSPLTNHGISQARALSAALSSIQFNSIHCSDLKRTFTTAEALRDGQSNLKLPIYQSDLLREQHFGSGEGKRWSGTRKPGLSLKEHYDKGIYPALRNRSERFPGGESLDDVARRAAATVNDLLMSYVREGDEDSHVAVVSHGLFLTELAVALVRMDGSTEVAYNTQDFHGMHNTGWTKIVVTAINQDRVERIGIETDENIVPVLRVRVTNINNCDHLINLKRQRGGIGSSAYDPQQKDIRAFFKGTKHACENSVEEVGPS